MGGWPTWDHSELGHGLDKFERIRLVTAALYQLLTWRYYNSSESGWLFCGKLPPAPPSVCTVWVGMDDGCQIGVTKSLEFCNTEVRSEIFCKLQLRLCVWQVSRFSNPPWCLDSVRMLILKFSSYPHPPHLHRTLQDDQWSKWLDSKRRNKELWYRVLHCRELKKYIFSGVQD